MSKRPNFLELTAKNLTPAMRKYIGDDRQAMKNEINRLATQAKKTIIKEHQRRTGLKAGARTFGGYKYGDKVELNRAKISDLTATIYLKMASFPIGLKKNISAIQNSVGVRVRNYFRKPKVFKSAFMHPNHKKENCEAVGLDAP